MKKAFICISFLLSVLAFQTAGVEIKGLGQVNYVFSDNATSWFDNGTSILAYSESSPNIQQAILRVTDSYPNGLSYKVVANYYQTGKQHLGLTQMQLAYKPLSNDTVRWRARGGFFYPKMSLENVDLGWLSPFTYTQSAINSWIGEELRTLGAELTLYSHGRSRSSAFSWELHGAAFKGNDTLGTLLSWRGFAMHDRQSLHNERVPFSPYPSVVEQDQVFHPAYVEPFHELDSHIGFYLGAHLDHYQKTRFRYYYYDNQADPLALNDQRLYAWRTKFHSFAFQHKFTASTRLISQWMTGSTAMGERAVYANFDAWYVMMSHKINQHRLSIRVDKFKVREDDMLESDKNDSHGQALTIAWRYDINRSWQLGLEHHFSKNNAENRPSVQQATEQNQQQSIAVLQYRW